ncbi:MAG: hypothetical protein IIV14_00750 [Bacteroidaceae bacterium]|nr:hypothetical protein [Bacteroidaceae bacterium]
MKKYPCKDCVPPKRHVGCHSTCKEYSDIQEENRAEREAMQEEARKNRIANNYACDVIHKCRKMAHRRKGW